MSYIAPAGTPLTYADILAGCAQGLADAGSSKLQTALRAHTQLPKAWPICSGRAAMTMVLAAMKEAADPARREVIVPAYTCYSVPAAVIRAGLQPRLCDVDPVTLSPRLEELQRFDARRVLALVSANLYGVPNDLPGLEAAARQMGAFMLDDGAQSLGAAIAHRPVGTFGDIGLYSFDKGKNITTLQGGALVARTGVLAHAVERHFERLPAAGAIDTLMLLAKLPVYSTLLRPALYGTVHRLPFLGLGRTVYEERYPITRLSTMLGGLAARMFERLHSINQVRVGNARRLMDALRGVAGIRGIEPLAGAEPVYVRLPLLVEDARQRQALLSALDRAGIGATGSYPQALCDVPEVAAVLPETDKNMPGARLVASSIVTLPTHPYCPPGLADRVREVALATAG
jgi:perosamine synthetase